MSKLSTVQGEIYTPLAAASWVTTAGFSVLKEDVTETFNSALATALNSKGIAFVVCAPRNLDAPATISGARVSGTTTIVVAVVCTTTSIPTIATHAENVISTVRSAIPRTLESVDFGPLEDENGQVGYYVSFSVIIDI